MITDQELDHLLHDFLSTQALDDNHEEFVQQVMKALPAPSPWFWLKEFALATAVFVGMMIFWNFKFLFTTVFLSAAAKSALYIQIQLQSISPQHVVAVLLFCFIAICYYSYEAIMEM